MMKFDLPSSELLREQAAWLAPARARLLRRIGIARRKSILDLGCGHGAVTGELARRAGSECNRRGGGAIFGLDHHPRGLVRVPNAVCGDAGRLPFAGESFDLVFCQAALMWMPLAETVSEIWRVLGRGGVLAAMEPDYGGMLEWPAGAGARDIWVAALERAGADPFVGRKLPGALERAGFVVRAEITPEIRPPLPARFGFLRGLPLTPIEQRQMIELGSRSGAASSQIWGQVVHLPFVLVTGRK